MTNEQRRWHERANDLIEAALSDLRFAFDIEAVDWRAAQDGDIKSDIKAVLVAAYARQHSWITER